MRNLNKIDVLAGVLVIVVGILSLIQASSLALGSARAMGPGYFPFYIGILMVIIGIGLIIEGRRPIDEAPEFGVLPKLRSVLLILAAVIAFAFLIERVGMVIAVAVAVFIGSLADTSTSWRQKLALTVAVPIFCVVVFKLGLGMTVDIFRWRL